MGLTDWIQKKINQTSNKQPFNDRVPTLIPSLIKNGRVITPFKNEVYSRNAKWTDPSVQQPGCRLQNTIAERQNILAPPGSAIGIFARCRLFLLIAVWKAAPAQPLYLRASEALPAAAHSGGAARPRLRCQTRPSPASPPRSGSWIAALGSGIAGLGSRAGAWLAPLLAGEGLCNSLRPRWAGRDAGWAGWDGMLAGQGGGAGWVG